jgi:citrate synthase
MLTAKKATVRVNGDEVELPIYAAKQGRSAVGLSKLLDVLGLLSYDRGCRITATVPSAITYVDGKEGKLYHRGYSIEDLATHKTFLELSYLLLDMNGALGVQCTLPSIPARNDFKSRLDSIDADLSEDIWRLLNGMKRTTPPMNMMASVVNGLALDDMPKKEALRDMPAEEKDRVMREALDKTIMRLMAMMPILVAMIHHYIRDEACARPDPRKSYVENFLFMMLGRDQFSESAYPVVLRFMDVFLSLHADHEQNASTNVVRCVGSTNANPYSGIAAGVDALSGDSHGGANAASLHMFEAIGDVSRIPEFVARAKDKNDSFLIMGVGHRVYKNRDPRAEIMKKLCGQVLDALGLADDPFFALARELEQVILKDEYFVSRNLYPNVDFYSGIILRALGIPTPMFPLIFALGRTTGWLSHWKEMMVPSTPMLAAKDLMRPGQMYVGEGPRTLPGDVASEPGADDIIVAGNRL